VKLCFIHGENIPLEVNNKFSVFYVYLALNEFNEFLPLVDSLKQQFVSTVEILDWPKIFIKVFNFEKDSSGTMTKISILRVILKFLWISKDHQMLENKNLH